MPGVELDEGLITMLKAAVPVLPFVSCTLVVKTDVPAVVGMPAMVPDDGESARPSGREPDAMLQV